MPSTQEYNDTKTDRELFGVFKEEHPGLGVGDPYTKPPDKSGRYTGKQFGVPFQPKGSGVDAMIDKKTPLTIPGDHYIESYAIQKILSSRGGRAPGKAWVPGNPSAQSVGKGSLYGTFGPAKNMLDTDASLGARSGKPEPAGKRNIYVTPAKTGGFGTLWQDRTIGGNKMEFIPDEFERGRLLEKDLKRTARQKFGKPFVASGRTGKGIVPITYATVPGADGKPPTFRAQDGNTLGRKPWKMSNPPQKGPGHGTINPLEYVPSPIVEAKRKDPNESSPKPFKPIGGGHNRLSMWSPNPHRFEARQPPDNDFTLLG